jgi:hypothetical protein
VFPQIQEMDFEPNYMTILVLKNGPKMFISDPRFEKYNSVFAICIDKQSHRVLF